MIEYDFIKLNDKEFESLSIDLISKLENRRIERFKSGKDAGVDGRFFASNGAEIIMQCKHWVRSGLPALIRNLRKIEILKVRKLKPIRYIFVTSVELSRQNKKTISEIFSPFIKSESDIYGKEDLNDLLSKHSEIEQKHYKLWMSSTNVLRALLNVAIIGRSRFKADEINDLSSKYVQTTNHEKAFEKLKSSHSVIITGEPGIGKTTLADHLCLFYIINNYEFCYIESSVAEAESVYDREKKQIYYFDDFLGRNYLQALGRHEDSHVINFIKRVSRDKYKRFILTSRTTILNQGKRLSDLFKIENIDRNEYELNIKSLSNFDKAKILYNHIWFSELDDAYIEELYQDKRYKKIIRHRNYNPRLISFITDAKKVFDISPNKYWGHVEDTLNNPSDIWGHVFDNQLDEHSRTIVSLVVFNGKEIQEDNLKKAFFYMANRENLSVPKYEISDFYSSVKLAVGALINRKIKERSTSAFYDLFNPAVGDYLVRRFSEDQSKLFMLFESLGTNESLENITNLLKSGIIASHIMHRLIIQLLIVCLSGKIKNKTIEYVVRLINLSIDQVDFDSELQILLQKWLMNINYEDIDADFYYELAGLLIWSLRTGIIHTNEFDFEKYFELALNETLEHDGFVELSKLFNELGDTYTEKYSQKFKKLILEYWEDMVDENIANEGILEGYFGEEEESEAMSSLYQYVSKNLSEYVGKFVDEDIESICKNCDVWQHIEDNRENASYEDDHHERAEDSGYSSISEDAAIDDLFDRTER